MSRTVHQPGGIEHNGIPQESGDTQAVFESFTPEIIGHKRGQDEAHQQDCGLVIPTTRDHTPKVSREDADLPDFHHPSFLLHCEDSVAGNRARGMGWEGNLVRM